MRVFDDVRDINGATMQIYKPQHRSPNRDTLLLLVDEAGGFTTAIACLRNHRRFIGCDNDKAAVVKGQERLAEERDGSTSWNRPNHRHSHKPVTDGEDD